MSEWTQPDRRMGAWAATSVAAIVGFYDIVGLFGVVARPPGPNSLRQVDPVPDYHGNFIDPVDRRARHHDVCRVCLRPP